MTEVRKSMCKSLNSLEKSIMCLKKYKACRRTGDIVKWDVK